METVRRKLNFANCLEVECRGLSGGLALLWDSEVQLEICSFSTNHIDSIVTSDKGKWRFTGIYGFPESNRKSATFRLLEHLRQHLYHPDTQSPNPIPNLPWYVLGDFNCIVSNQEKQGGALYG